VTDLRSFVSRLRASGRVYFSIREVAEELRTSVSAIETATTELIRRHILVELTDGFFVVQEADQRLDCAPDPSRWVDGLMRFLGVPYRVAFQESGRTPLCMPCSLKTYYLVVPARFAPISAAGHRIDFVYLSTDIFEQTNRPAWLEKISRGTEVVTAAGMELALLDYTLLFHGRVAPDPATSTLEYLADIAVADKLREIAAVYDPAVARRLRCMLKQRGYNQLADAAWDPCDASLDDVESDDTGTGDPSPSEPRPSMRIEIERVNAELSRIEANGANEREFLKAELSRLHHLVTARMASQIAFLHRQAYDLKRIAYHANQPVVLGAFNGQFSKHRVFSALRNHIRFEVFIETGSYLGKTTEFLATLGQPVYSVERNPEFYQKAQALLQGSPLVHLNLEDSTEFLQTLLSNELSPSVMAFFYLDAHWYNPLPLRDELGIIAKQHPHAVVMIDDFKVEDDEGYGYDSYEFGQEVTLEFLQKELRDSNWHVFFPSLPAALDQNAIDILPPRGTAILACEPDLINTLKELKELRYWPLAGQHMPV
jgi:hypothetical protein